MSDLNGKISYTPSSFDEVKEERKLEGSFQQHDGYSESSASWCAWGDGNGRNPEKRYKESEQILCTKKGGGVIGMKGACTSKFDPNDIIFVLKSEIKYVGDMFCTYTIEATLIEATERPLSAEFIEKSRIMISSNEKPLREMIDQSIQLKKRAEKIRAAELQRSRDSLGIMKKRGTMICKNDGQWSHAAYVEDSSSDRFRVLISRTFLTSNPAVTPGGFKQEVAWIDPLDRWYPCGMNNK